MTINNNDGIILLSCPLHTLICSDSQICSFINSPSAVICDGEVRQQNLHVPSLTVFFFSLWIISVFSFVYLWDGGEEKARVREGANVLFDMSAYHTEQHCRTELPLVTLSHLPFSCLFSRRINTLRNWKYKAHPWLIFFYFWKVRIQCLLGERRKSLMDHFLTLVTMPKPILMYDLCQLLIDYPEADD